MSKSLDRLALLSTFTRIAERGSISAAARDLNMSQASASRQLAELERRLGVTLIQRTTHSLALTEAGHKTLVEARMLNQCWEALIERFQESEAELSGTLKIVAPVALGQLHLAEAVLTFQAAHPNVSISWILEDEDIRFAEAGCDLWIKIGHPLDDTLVVQEIATVERLVAAAPSLLDGTKLKHPSELANIPCAALGPFEGGSIPLIGKSDDAFDVDADVTIATNNIFSAHKAALMGLGYAVLPRWLIDAELKDRSLESILPDWNPPSLTITASYLPSQRQSFRLKAMLSHMKKAILSIEGIDAKQTDTNHQNLD